MYTKQSLSALRDEFLDKKKEIWMLPLWSTVSFICQAITLYSDPEEIEEYLRQSAVTVKGLPTMNDSEIDYELAYNLLYGDISLAPLHINDALKIVAQWRFKNEGSTSCTPNKI